MWLASFKQPSAVHGEVGKSATSVGLRAPAGRFDAAKGESIDTGSGRRAVSSSPGRGPWAAGSSGGVQGGAEECIKMSFPARLVARTLRMSRLLPAAAVAVALGEARHDRGTVGGRWLGRDARRR